MSDNNIETFWERLGQAMRVAGESSLRNFCVKAGLPYQTILNQKSQKRYPATSMLIILARELKCSLDWLIFGDETMKKEDNEEYQMLVHKKEIIDRIIMSESPDLLDSLDYIFKPE